MAAAIGIDLGTTYTVVAAIQGGEPCVIPNAEGQRLTPSVVAVARDGRHLVGQMARRQAEANPDGTVASIKRHMGSDRNVKLRGREYTPQEVSSLILRKVKADAEDYLGDEVDAAVITVPAYFNDRQRQATKEAGLMAGLKVLRIINEPTASALAYGLHREEAHTVLVWDLGGGTFDVSILELEQGIFQVRAVGGDTWLGGDDFDQAVADYLAERYREEHGSDFPADGSARQRLREAAERAKIALSTESSTNIYIPHMGRGSESPTHLEATLTRAKLEQLTRRLLQRMVGPTRQALSDAGLEPQGIDRLLLVGGATRMPAVRRLARRLIGKAPYQNINPDETVALGAAIQAGMLLGLVDRAVLLDVLPLSLGVQTLGGLFARIIRRNTPLPASETRIFTTALDSQASVDVHVLQGERALADDNVLLGQLHLEGIPPLPRGLPKIEVAFDVDVDGLVHVAARDLLTESEQRMKVVFQNGLCPAEIQRIIHEAEASAEEDKERRRRIEAGIRADNAIGAAETLLPELHALDAHQQVSETQEAVLMVKEALASGETDEIERRSNQLTHLLSRIHNEVQYAAEPAFLPAANRPARRLRLA